MAIRRYKKRVLTVILVCMGAMLPMEQVKAGSINGVESALIGYANQTFTFNGHSYKATDDAIATLTAKLNEDQVDLSEEQSQKAKAMIDSHIEAGIAAGYLVEVADEANKDDNKTEQTENVEDKGKQPINKQDKQPIDINNEIEGIIKNPSTTNKPVDGKKEDNTEIETPVTVEHYPEGHMTVANKSDVILECGLPVKNTGYSTERSVRILKIFVIGAAITMGAAVYYIWLRRQHD